MSAAKATPADARLLWLDIARGWCILLVVMMHSALGVGLALGDIGWLHALVAFAKPFRIPDFFLLSGLFAATAIQWPWRMFLDRKVLHFAYFYALWLAIILLAKSAETGIRTPADFLLQFGWGLIEPFSSMWFIHLLPLLFLATRLLRAVPLWLALAAAALLHLGAALHPHGGAYAMASLWSGWTTPDQFALFFIYFLIGAHFRAPVFAFANLCMARPGWALAGLLAWALAEMAVVRGSVASIPGITLVVGLAGSLAVIAVSALLARAGRGQWLAYCGSHSLVVYLAFVLPMATARLLLVRAGMTDIGWMSLIVACVAIAAPLALERATRKTFLAFLFQRPGWARLPAAPLNASAPQSSQSRG